MYLILATLLVGCLAAPECLSCANCAVCTRKEYYNDTHVEVWFDFSTCKGSAISWACCRGASLPNSGAGLCDLLLCDGSPSPSSAKCDEVSMMRFVVSASATSLTLQLHDGRFNGNYVCGPQQPCCGGSGSSCADSGVCQVVVSLDTCLFVPQCASNLDCQNLNTECAMGLCLNGLCVQQLAGSDVMCRPATSTCDIPEYCTGSSPTCPPDVRKDKGYTYKCATTQFLCAITPSDLTKGNGEAYYINQSGDSSNSCNIGTAKPNSMLNLPAFVELSWPSCVSTCLAQTCPNSRGISNFALTHCDDTTGTWMCDSKVDIFTNITFPYCPYA